MDEAPGEKPLHQSQIRCVFVDGPLDGKTTDIDAYLPHQTPPEWIDADHPTQSVGLTHRYVKDGDVEDRPGLGRVLVMRYDGARPKPPTGGRFNSDRAVAEQYLQQLRRQV